MKTKQKIKQENKKFYLEVLRNIEIQKLTCPVHYFLKS